MLIKGPTRRDRIGFGGPYRIRRPIRLQEYRTLATPPDGSGSYRILSVNLRDQRSPVRILSLRPRRARHRTGNRRAAAFVFLGSGAESMVRCAPVKVQPQRTDHLQHRGELRISARGEGGWRDSHGGSLISAGADRAAAPQWAREAPSPAPRRTQASASPTFEGSPRDPPSRRRTTSGASPSRSPR